MKITITAEAEADIERIGDYIAADNPSRAASFVRELVARCERLRDMPHAYPVIPRYGHHDIRRIPHGSYLIFYRVDESEVVILHILNGAQDYEAILFPGAD